MQPRLLGQVEEFGKTGLPRGRGGEVVPADHLGDPTGRIVDDDGKVVGEHAVTAPEHDVVDRCRDRAEQSVGHGDLPVLRAQPQGRSPARGGQGGPRLGALLLGEVAARARIRPRWGVRGGGGLLDVLARAVAFVDESRLIETGDRLSVDVETRGLDEGVVVGHDPEVGEHRPLGLRRARPDPVEVLDAPEEALALLPGARIREHPGADVADVEVAAGARGVPTGSRPHLSATRSAYCGNRCR